MITSKNLVVLIGNVGADPMINREYDFCSFSLATTEKYKDRNGDKKEIVEWHNVNVNSSKLGEYINKGDLLSVTGRIRTTKSKKDDKYFTNIVADNVQFLKKKNDNQQGAVGTSTKNASESNDPLEQAAKQFDNQKGENIPDEGDDLPF